MKLGTFAALAFTALVLCSAFLGAVPHGVEAGSTVDVIVGFKGVPDLELLQGSGGVIHEIYSLIPAVFVSLPQSAAEELKENPKIAYVDGNDVLTASGTVNWAADAVNASNAWSQSTGAGVKVAVLDTGSGPARDLTIRGGYNFVSNNNNYNDDNGHGTMVAGIIGAAASSSIGVSGVAPSAQIYALKILDKDGVGTVDEAVAGVQWAVTNGMQIISMSWTLNDLNGALEGALDAAYNHGVLLVAAAGNSGDVSSAIWVPASYDSVIAVSGVMQDYTRLPDSCFGSKIELTAPGEMVYSTWLNNQLGVGNGTSMAAPFVSGVAALIWAKNPSLTNLQVRAILDGTASDLGTPGRDIFYGFGLVNASAAVLATPSNLAVGFSISPSTAYSAAPVNFDASASFGGVNGYTTYLWDFGDGSTAATNSPMATHIFGSPGSYAVNLSVNDTFGFSNSTVQTVAVQRDSAAPVTSDNYDGLVHTSAFTIVLTAQDSQSGVAATYYKINGGQTLSISVAGQPRISSEGYNTLEYWSVDFAGNMETSHVITGIKLDTSSSIQPTPTQSPPPTVKPTEKPTATPTPTASTNPTGGSTTPAFNGEELPFYVVLIIAVAAGFAAVSAVVIWFKRK